MEYKKLLNATITLYNVFIEIEKIYIHHGDFENPEVRKAAFKGARAVVKNFDDLKYAAETIYDLHSHFFSTSNQRQKIIHSGL